MKPQPVFFVQNVANGATFKAVTWEIIRVDSDLNVYGKANTLGSSGETQFIGHAEEMWQGITLETIVKIYRLDTPNKAALIESLRPDRMVL